MKSPDIAPISADKFDWSIGKRADSLQATKNKLTERLKTSIDWYQKKRAIKRRAAWWFRIGAIVFGTLAAIVPTVSEMTLHVGGAPISPGYATILGVLAGTLIVLDKLMGASSSWIRFTMAETSLRELVDELDSAFKIETGSWAEIVEPTLEQTRHALATLQGFIDKYNQIIREETSQWKLEFQSALQISDDLAKSLPRPVQEVIGVIKIANPDRLVAGWTASINGGPEMAGAEDSKAFHTGPGPVTITVRAKIKVGVSGNARDYIEEVGDVLVGGSSKTFSITLPQS